MFRDLLALSFHEQRPVEHVVLCLGTYWPCPSMSRDLLNMSCHVQGPVGPVLPWAETCWTCRAMYRDLLNMSCHDRGPIDLVLPCTGTCWTYPAPATTGCATISLPRTSGVSSFRSEPCRTTAQWFSGTYVIEKIRKLCCRIFKYIYFWGVLQCVCHSFDYVAHFVFLRDVWIRTQRAAV